MLSLPGACAVSRLPPSPSPAIASASLFVVFCLAWACVSRASLVYQALMNGRLTTRCIGHHANCSSSSLPPRLHNRIASRRFVQHCIVTHLSSPHLLSSPLRHRAYNHPWTDAHDTRAPEFELDTGHPRVLEKRKDRHGNARSEGREGSPGNTHTYTHAHTLARRKQEAGAAEGKGRRREREHEHEHDPSGAEWSARVGAVRAPWVVRPPLCGGRRVRRPVDCCLSWCAARVWMPGAESFGAGHLSVTSVLCLLALPVVRASRDGCGCAGFAPTPTGACFVPLLRSCGVCVAGCVGLRCVVLPLLLPFFFLRLSFVGVGVECELDSFLA